MKTLELFMRNLSILLTLVAIACTDMEPTGHPFSPAPTDECASSSVAEAPGVPTGTAGGETAPADPQETTGAAGEPAGASDGGFQTQFREVPGFGDEAEADDAVADLDTDAQGDAAAAPDAAMQGMMAQPGAAPLGMLPPGTAMASMYGGVASGVALPSVGGWPIRLVATVPQGPTPRAILGLPSGTEIVVTPGSMLPEQGLVVLAVGPNSVQLASISPAGDHARVAPMTLTSQY